MSTESPINAKPITCTPRSRWARILCAVQRHVEFLCEKRADGTIPPRAAFGIGATRIFHAFTECGCCHGWRLIVLGLALLCIGRFTPFWFSLALYTLAVGASYFVGHQFIKEKQNEPK